MRLALHLHHQSFIDRFKDPLIDFVLTEPFTSTKHPYVIDRESFLDLLQASLASGQRTFIEINGFIDEADLQGLTHWIKTLIAYRPTGFLFADPAVLMILKEQGFLGETVYAPETILTNTLEVGTLLKEVSRVMIAKELTLSETLILAETFGDRIEAFGAGHLPMSVSRRPLLSSYLNHLGQAQDVLNKTDFRIRELKRKETMPILEEARSFTVFTEGILNPLRALPQLMNAKLYGLHLDPLWMEEQDAFDYFTLILQQVHAYDPSAIETFIKSHPHLPLFEGYYDRKTNLSKETV